MVLSIQDNVSLYQKILIKRKKFSLMNRDLLRRMKTQRAKSMPIIFKILDQKCDGFTAVFLINTFDRRYLQPIKWKNSGR